MLGNSPQNWEIIRFEPTIQKWGKGTTHVVEQAPCSTMQWREESRTHTEWASISSLRLNGLPWQVCWSGDAPRASRKRQQIQGVEKMLGWTGPRETSSKLTQLSHHLYCFALFFFFNIILCVSSQPQSSHLANGESNLQSDFSLNTLGILLTLNLLHSVSNSLWVIKEQRLFWIYLCILHTQSMSNTQYMLLNKSLMDKWMHKRMDFLTKKRL